MIRQQLAPYRVLERRGVCVRLRLLADFPFPMALDMALGARSNEGSRQNPYGTGGGPILRRSLCSHLAMRGAPARAIQELAGHEDLKTTQRYMHVSPAAVDDAIRLLDAVEPRWLATGWQRDRVESLSDSAAVS